ncbi:MAG TPA: MraY family glycosyltransferase [Longimicrobiaceae bacterium]|nr:MraY family glycosyltransferase [Longimicrobiaceae bacterium]
MLAHIAIFVVALLTGAILTPLVIRTAIAWEMLDPPHEDRRVHTEPIPRVGGVAVFVAMGVGLLLSALAALFGIEVLNGPRSFFYGVLFGGGIIFATGLVDDVRGLRPGAKLAAQLVAASVAYAYGFRIEILGVGSTELTLGWFSLPLTILWIVGVTNAFNLIDGLDGLATGIALVALLTTLTVSLALGNVEVSLLSVALLGALFGFLRYNFNPARIFLGDSGSLFIGFMLAVLSVYGSQKSATAILAVVPVFALAIPLLDTTLAILRRWLRGVPLSQADGRHIHHRLLALGLTHRNAVIVLYVAASVLAMLGLSFVFAPPPAVMSVAAAGAGVTLFLLVYGLRRLQYHEFVEAGSVLASGLLRVRRIIRDQICAQDLGQVVRLAETLEEVNAILEDNASAFGFLHMEVCRESAVGSRPLVLFDGHAARAWKLDYPVTWHDFVEGDDYVLRIWCNPRTGSQLYGAERVAQIVAPVIEEWMERCGPQRAGARVHTHSLMLEQRVDSDRVGVGLEAVEGAAFPARLGLVRPRA